jgi:hypothetical protein
MELVGKAGASLDVLENHMPTWRSACLRMKVSMIGAYLVAGSRCRHGMWTVGIVDHV